LKPLVGIGWTRGWCQTRSPSRNTPEWQTFAKRYRAEMKRPPAARLLDLLAAFSQQAALSVGCYCAEEAQRHRSILKELLEEHGARIE